MKRVYFVRHAQTAWNFANRIQGGSDVPLDDVGERQAERLGAWFASRHLRGIVTSALQRSRQTAMAIAAGNGHDVRPSVVPDLREMHLGAWEGLTPEDVDRQFHGAYRQWQRRPSSVRIPGAEALDAFQVRVRRVMDELIAGWEAGDYVVVTHGGVIAAVLADVVGADYDALLRRVRLDNAGVTAVAYRTTQRDVLWINGTSHLDSAGASPAARD